MSFRASADRSIFRAPSIRAGMRSSLLLGLMAIAWGPVEAVAQTAQELLAKSMKVHVAQRVYEGTSDSRSLSLILVRQENESEADSRYEIRDQDYGRIGVKMRLPSEWCVTVDTQHMHISSRVSAYTEAHRSILMRNREGAAKAGYYHASDGTKGPLKEITPTEFNKTLQQTLVQGGNQMRGDLVLRYCLPSMRIMGNLPWGLVSAQIKREEVGASGGKVYCISAKTTEDQQFLVWVDAGTLRITRVVQYISSFRQGDPAKTDYVKRDLRFMETVYTYVENPEFPADGFEEPSKMAPDLSPQENETPFADIADIISLLSDAIVASDPEYVRAAARAAEKIKTTPVVTSQFLTQEQMKSIVLIEGDKGVASGFIAKIKDVDFVVTNLHVLGANTSITVRSVNGKVVPTSGIFGAVGSDIAIMRVANSEGSLSLATDLLKTAKIGGKVIVVGNRQGGGVATEVIGNIKGIGPTRIEVDANFQPGNSGSPIIAMDTGEIIGVAAYMQVMPPDIVSFDARQSSAVPLERRWFGFRLDGIQKWEPIDLAKWQAQSKRVEQFRETSDALLAMIQGRFKDVHEQPRLTGAIANLKVRLTAAGSSSANVTVEVKDYLRKVRAIAEEGLREFSSDEFYDYYQTCLYWQESVPNQIEYRQALIRALKNSEDSPLGYTTRLRK